MEITHAKEGEISVITINGRLDAATAPVADKTIKNILEGDCLRMLFDFSKLDYLGSGGLRIILGAIKELSVHSAPKIAAFRHFFCTIFKTGTIWINYYPAPGLIKAFGSTFSDTRYSICFSVNGLLSRRLSPIFIIMIL